MKYTLDDYMQMSYRIEVTRNTEGDYIIEIPELTDCLSSASQTENIISNAYDAIKACLADNIPLPTKMAS